MHIGAKVISLSALPLLLPLFNGAFGAESTPTPTFRIAFAVSEGPFAHQERRSVVAVFSAGKLLQEVGTDFTQPLLVNIIGPEPVNLFIVPCIGDVTNGISGSVKVDPSTDPATVQVSVRPAVPITVRLKSPDGKYLSKSRITVSDTTHEMYGYVNLSLVGYSNENGSFTFNGFSGETYELESSIYEGGQNISVKFPAIAVKDGPIKSDLAYAAPPSISLLLVSVADRKEMPFNGSAIVGIVQDNFPALQSIPIDKNGGARFSLGSDDTHAAVAKSLKLFIKGYDLDPNIITINDNISKTVKISCTKKMEAKPNDRPMMQEFALNVVDVNDDPMTTGTAFYMKIMESVTGRMKLETYMIPYTDKKYIGKAGDKPFIGYILYASKYFDMDAVFATKALVAPGEILQMKVDSAPHIASIQITDADASVDKPIPINKFLLYADVTFCPLTGFKAVQGSFDKVRCAAFPGKYKVIYTKDRLHYQVIGSFEINTSDAQEKTFIMSLKDAVDIDQKAIADAQIKDLSSK